MQKGEWLIREGEPPWFFVLLEGALDVEKEFGGASEVRGHHKPGDFYVETPILLDSPTIASFAPRSLPEFSGLIASSSRSSSIVPPNAAT